MPTKRLPVEIWYIIFDHLNIDCTTWQIIPTKKWLCASAKPWHLILLRLELIILHPDLFATVDIITTLLWPDIFFPRSHMAFRSWLVSRVTWKIKNVTQAKFLLELEEIYQVRVKHVMLHLRDPEVKRKALQRHMLSSMIFEVRSMVYFTPTAARAIASKYFWEYQNFVSSEAEAFITIKEVTKLHGLATLSISMAPTGHNGGCMQCGVDLLQKVLRPPLREVRAKMPASRLSVRCRKQAQWLETLCEVLQHDRTMLIAT